MPNSSPWGAFALSQLSGRQPEAKKHIFNPHPPGILQSGSATQAILQFLQSNPGRYFNCHQIILSTGRTAKSVDWGLLMLRSMNLLELRRDDRSDRYWKYCFKPVLVDEGDDE